MVSYQIKAMIAYAIVRHHPDKKIIRAILSSVVSDPTDRTDPNDQRTPHEWRDTFTEILNNMDSRAYNVHAVLMRALVDAGPCPRLVTIPDILQMLEIDVPTSPR